MKRDGDFVRELLLEAEASGDPPMHQPAPDITSLNNYIFVVTLLT